MGEPQGARMKNQARSDVQLSELLSDVKRRVLIWTTLRTLGWATVAGVGVGGALIWSGSIFGLPSAAVTLFWAIPALVLATTTVLVFRAYSALTPDRLALLVDEHAGLGHMATTLRAANTSGLVADAFHRRALAALAPVDARQIVSFAQGRIWTFCVVSAVLAAGALTVAAPPNALPSSERSSSSGADRSSRERGIGSADQDAIPTLGLVEFTVTPPAYANLPATGGGAGEPMAALPGSRILVSGSGTATPPAFTASIVGGGSLRPTTEDGSWRLAWTTGPDDRGLALTVSLDDEIVDQQVLALRLLRDRPPVVTLAAPAEDLVLATPKGVVAIRAVTTDDYGVGEATLHWVRSRGSGESFDFDEGTWTWDRSTDSPDGQISTLSLELETLGLEAGDVLHVRATAIDRNDVTGPGIGVSATRQIRISRESDLSDITTLVGFPIDREREPLLSQRMIILLTEELLDSAATLTRADFVERAIDIADDQARLRARIGEQIFSRATGAMQDPEEHLDFEEGEAEVFLDELEAMAEQGPVIDPETGMASIANVDIPAHEHDSDPIVAINRSLLSVYNYMWDAERDLHEAALTPSLVPQNLALDELQRVRDSERIFARGRVAVAPIDVDVSRGTGDLDDASPGARTATVPATGTRQQVAVAIDDLLTSTPVATGRVAAVGISGLALDLLESTDQPEPSEILALAAASARVEDPLTTASELRRALRLLRANDPRAVSGRAGRPASIAAARYRTSIAEAQNAATRTSAEAQPFVFATVRYESGDWDSAPLVPTNLIHSLAQYTDLPVAPEGVIVDLSSPRIFDYPFLYMTGHLPVFFGDAEARNLTDFVERGGLIFIDDHNHDIDGAFHRSITTELGRLFGAESLQAIPNDHELYSAFFPFDDGPPITGHELSGWGDGLIHRELYQVEVAGRIGVLYSNKDYSSEWSYHADNKRFLAIDNTRFGVNILIYALTR